MTMQAHQEKICDRTKAVVGVAFCHVLLGYALITGLHPDIASRANDPLKVFDIAEEHPPPPVEPIVPADRKPDAPKKDAASSPNLEAERSPIVAPPPEVQLDTPPPVMSSPVGGPGDNDVAGSAAVAGPGSGGGGQGTGTGSDGRGARRARQIAGRIVDADYPRAARRARAEGSVLVHFAVGSDGRPSGCRVMQSSGNADLDETTCRLIEQRFRFEPAIDTQGRLISEVKAWNQIWWLEPR